MTKRNRASARRGHADPTARIRQAIVDGELFPNERLVEQDLVTRFGANRGAIRMALAVLEQQGLVIRELNRGARVRAVTEQEAVEIEEARCVLEQLTAHHAAIHATADEILELQQRLEVMESATATGNLFGFSDLNANFHLMIAEISGHSTAHKMLIGLRSQTISVQFRPILEPGRAAQINAEHRVLVSAIAAHTPNAAEAAMRVHLDNSVLALKAAIKSRRVVRRPMIVAGDETGD